MNQGESHGKIIKILSGEKTILEIRVPDEFEILISPAKPSTPYRREIDLTPRLAEPMKPEKPEEKMEKQQVKTEEKKEGLIDIEGKMNIEAVRSIREEVKDAEELIRKAFEEVEGTTREEKEEKPEKEAGEEPKETLTELMSKEIANVEEVSERVSAMLGMKREEAEEEPEKKDKEEKAKELLSELLEIGAS